MRAVLYANDLEPITVVDLPMPLWERLERGDCVHLKIMEPLKLVAAADALAPVRYWTVSLRGERLELRGQRSLMVFVDDEEAALLLKADFLPGQRREVNRLREDAGGFAKGFLAAVELLHSRRD